MDINVWNLIPCQLEAVDYYFCTYVLITSFDWHFFLDLLVVVVVVVLVVFSLLIFIEEIVFGSS